MLYLITKLQNLKAIHNMHTRCTTKQLVVSNYKITKSESYSQRTDPKDLRSASCI